MASYQGPETEQLYGCLGTPGSMVCGQCFSLKTGVILVAVCDSLVAIISLYYAVALIQSDFFETDAVLYELGVLFAVSAVPFAILGFIGVTQTNQPYVHLYSQFKQVELPVLLVYDVLMAYFQTSGFSLNLDEVAVFFVIVFLQILLPTAVNLYFTHIVWSTDVRLRRNETILVMYGADALKQLQEPIITRRNEEQNPYAPSAPYEEGPAQQ